MFDRLLGGQPLPEIADSSPFIEGTDAGFLYGHSDIVELAGVKFDSWLAENLSEDHATEKMTYG
jgi:hypothetical protein